MPKIKWGRLLTVENAKTSKGEKLGYLTGILYLTPDRAPGIDSKSLCPFSTAGCRAGCLNTAGRGVFNSVQAGRARKRTLLSLYPREFVAQLAREITALEKRASRAGLKPVVRLNGTSDIPWETRAPELFSGFPNVQFYDYSKIPSRFSAGRGLPKNYDLTYSRAENRDDTAHGLLPYTRVAVVFSTPRGKPLPRKWYGRPVIDGDAHDLRFTERKRNVVVGLRAKGKARFDRSGFVVQVV